MLGLCRCADFSVVAARRAYSPAVMCELLVAVVSLVVECRLCGCRSFRSCGGMWRHLSGSLVTTVVISLGDFESVTPLDLSSSLWKWSRWMGPFLKFLFTSKAVIPRWKNVDAVMFSEKAEIACSGWLGKVYFPKGIDWRKIYNAYIVRLLHIYFSVFNSI